MIRWDNAGENTLWLFTPEEFNQLPDGIVLSSISGGTFVKGKDYIDDDTRAGHLAYGVRDIQHHEHKKLLLAMLLKR